jgi:hypothetical protein
MNLSLLVIQVPNKDEFEPTISLSVSGMTYVRSYPMLLVEGEAHQYINSNAKYISTLGLIFLREARTKS